MTGLNSYADLRTAVLKFYSSESNSDYVNPGKTFRGSKTYNEFLKKLRKHKVFPEESLVFVAKHIYVRLLTRQNVNKMC